MSYSFSVTGSTKEEAIEAAKEEMDKVVVNQPPHAADAPAVAAAVNAFVELLADDTSKKVGVSVHGSLSWKGSDPAISIAGANLSVTVSLM